MWHGNAIYFISDRDGVMNLFSYDLATKQTKKLTDYKEYDIKWPSLGTGRDRVRKRWPALRIQPPKREHAQHSHRSARRGSGSTTRVQERDQEHRKLWALSIRRARGAGSPRQHFHRAGRAWQHSHADDRQFQRPRTQSGVVSGWKVDRLSIGQNRRIRDLHAAADGRRGNARHFGRCACIATARCGRPTARNCSTGTRLHRLWWIGVDEKKPAQVDEGEYADIADGSWSAGQPVDRLFQSRSARCGSDVPVFARSEEDDQDLGRLLQRLQSGVRSRRQVRVLPLATLLLPQHRPARPALQLLQHGRNVCAIAQGRRSLSLQTTERRGKSRRQRRQGQGQG